MPPGKAVQIQQGAAGCRQAVAVLLGGVLFFAAMLKLYALAGYPSLSMTGVGRAWQAAIIGIEAALAAGLVLLRPHPLIWRSTAAFFVIAAGASAASWFSGRETCGCFGMARVPVASLSVSLVGLVLLHVLRPAAEPPRARVGLAGVLALGLALGVAAGIGGPRVAAWQASRRLPRAESPTAVFDTLDWLGRPFPAWKELTRAGVPDEWRQHAVLLITRPGCSTCEWTAAGNDLLDLARRIPVAIVQLDGSQDPLGRPPAEGMKLRHAGVGPRDWYFALPAIVVIRSGRVVEAYHGRQAVEWISAQATRQQREAALRKAQPSAAALAAGPAQVPPAHLGLPSVPNLKHRRPQVALCLPYRSVRCTVVCRPLVGTLLLHDGCFCYEQHV